MKGFKDIRNTNKISFRQLCEVNMLLHQEISDTLIPCILDISMTIGSCTLQGKKDSLWLPCSFAAVDTNMPDGCMGVRKNMCPIRKKRSNRFCCVHGLKVLNYQAPLGRLNTGTVEHGSPNISDLTTGTSLLVRAT